MVINVNSKGDTMYRILSSGILILSIVGCATVPMGDPRKDTALKQFATSPDSAGLYIYRNETFGAAILMNVMVDGELLGQTASKTYFFKQVSPGKHTVTSLAEGTDTIEVNTVAGKLYYIWQEVKMGLWSASSKLHLVSEDEGKKGVLESKLAASSGGDGAQKY